MFGPGSQGRKGHGWGCAGLGRGMEVIGGRVGLVIPSPPKSSHEEEMRLLIDEEKKKRKGREEGVNSTDPSIKNKKRRM